MTDSPLAKALKSPVSIFAATAPEKFTSISEITSLSLAYSNLVTLPESLCNPHPLPPFITLSSATHAGSFLSFTVSLINLVDVDLHGNDNLDFGALSQWLNQSSAISLDLSWIPQWRDGPNELMPVMRSTTKLKHLRFPLILAVSFHLSSLLTVLRGRLFGCPYAEDEFWHDAETKAQNAVTRAKNSKFALAVIQTLLDTSVNNYQSVL